MFFLLSPDFTYEHFCQEAAEELLRVKDLEKRLEHYNLMAELVNLSNISYISKKSEGMQSYHIPFI